MVRNCSFVLNRKGSCWKVCADHVIILIQMSPVIFSFFTWAHSFSLKMVYFISRNWFCIFLKRIEVLFCPYFRFDHGAILTFQDLLYPSGLILLVHFFFCLDGVSLSLWQFSFVCWLLGAFIVGSPCKL